MQIQTAHDYEGRFGLAISDWNFTYSQRGSHRAESFQAGWILGPANGGQRRCASEAVAGYPPCASQCPIRRMRVVAVSNDREVELFTRGE